MPAPPPPARLEVVAAGGVEDVGGEGDSPRLKPYGGVPKIGLLVAVSNAGGPPVVSKTRFVGCMDTHASRAMHVCRVSVDSSPPRPSHHISNLPFDYQIRQARFGSEPVCL